MRRGRLLPQGPSLPLLPRPPLFSLSPISLCACEVRCGAAAVLSQVEAVVPYAVKGNCKHPCPSSHVENILTFESAKVSVRSADTQIILVRENCPEMTQTAQ